MTQEKSDANGADAEEREPPETFSSDTSIGIRPLLAAVGGYVLMFGILLSVGLLLIVALGVAQRIGWISAGDGATEAAETSQVYTCSMHPQIHLPRSEEHTSELQSRRNLVCRLLLEKKKSPPT